MFPNDTYFLWFWMNLIIEGKWFVVITRISMVFWISFLKISTKIMYLQQMTYVNSIKMTWRMLTKAQRVRSNWTYQESTEKLISLHGIPFHNCWKSVANTGTELGNFEYITLPATLFFSLRNFLHFIAVVSTLRWRSHFHIIVNRNVNLDFAMLSTSFSLHSEVEWLRALYDCHDLQRDKDGSMPFI